MSTTRALGFGLFFTLAVMLSLYLAIREGQALHAALALASGLCLADCVRKITAQNRTPSAGETRA